MSWSSKRCHIASLAKTHQSIRACRRKSRTHILEGVMLLRLIAAGFMAALLLSSNASAQDASPVTGSPTETEATLADEQVIVRGQRLSELEFDLRTYIKDFVDEVAAPARSRGYARWQRSVCIGVHNLETTAAQYIVDRISSLALEL
jgi:hypothetical protein